MPRCSALPGRLPRGSRIEIWPALEFALLLPLRCAIGLFLLQDYRRYILLLLLMFVSCHPYASIALKLKKITQRLNCMKGASVIAWTRNNALSRGSTQLRQFLPLARTSLRVRLSSHRAYGPKRPSLYRKRRTSTGRFLRTPDTTQSAPIRRRMTCKTTSSYITPHHN